MFHWITSVFLALIWALSSSADTALPIDSKYFVTSDTPVSEKYSVVTTDSMEIKMTFAEQPLADKSAPVFLFIHGFSGSKQNWLTGNPNDPSIAELVWRSGYPTATMHLRGHGEGDNRSELKKGPAFNPFFPLDFYIPGRRGFSLESSTVYAPDRMTLDLQAAIDNIYSLTGRKIVLVGHSMGEMVSKHLLSGVRYDPKRGKNFEISEDRTRAFNEKHIQGLVGIGGPSDLSASLGESIGMNLDESAKFHIRQFLALHSVPLQYLASENPNRSWLEEYLKSDLAKWNEAAFRFWFPLAEPAVKSLDDIALRALAKSLEKDDLMRTVMGRLMASMIGPPGNFDLSSDEVRELLKGAGSKVAFGAMLQSLHWMGYGYKSRDGNVEYANRKVLADVLMVRGAQDFFTPENLYAKEAAVFGENARYIVFPETGHLGLLARSRRAPLYNGMMEFLHNPETDKYPTGHDISRMVLCRALF